MLQWIYAAQASLERQQFNHVDAAGDTIELRAEMGPIIGFIACGALDSNGGRFKPRSITGSTVREWPLSREQPR